MRLRAEQRIAASREAIWEALNDPEVLRRSIPGCESIEKIADSELVAAVIAKVGPVKAKFKGKVWLSDIDPPNRYRIVGEGEGGNAGFAKGDASVALVADGDDTVLKYDIEATVGGKLAQIGSRLVDATARKMADEFFTRFSRIVSVELAPDMEASLASQAAATQGLSPMIWVPLLVVAVTLVTLIFT